MKKLIKKFLFWFVLMGVIVNVISITGSDDKNIILIGLNPLLNLLESNNTIREFTKSIVKQKDRLQQKCSTVLRKRGFLR